MQQIGCFERTRCGISSPRSGLAMALVLGLSVSLLSCDIGQKTQTKEVADFSVSLTQKPTILTANEPSEFYATLRKNRSGLSGCAVRYYLYQLTSTQALKPDPSSFKNFPEREHSGVYWIKGAFFNAPGEWEMDLELGCEDAVYHVKFPLAAVAKATSSE